MFKQHNVNNEYGNGSESYNERQKHINIAEQLFIEWALKKQYNINRIGFNEKDNSITNFYDLNIVIRNIPDFIINRDNKSFIVNVKGTANIKKKEYDIIPTFIKCFSSEKVPLIYSFCFKDKDPIFKSSLEIIRLYEDSKDKSWSDGVIYRSIKL